MLGLAARRFQLHWLFQREPTADRDSAAGSGEEAAIGTGNPGTGETGSA